jgi:hypothetical protein
VTIRYEYPLRWPAGWPRTEPSKRGRASYKVDYARAVADLERELGKLGSRDVVVSSDVPLRRDGRPYSDGDPRDPGVAVYWTLLNQPRAMAIDRWLLGRENVRAMYFAFESLRSFERTGAKNIMERAYAGFAQLPPGANGVPTATPPQRPWREVLQLEGLAGPAFAVRAAVEASFKSLAAKHHPDAGGSAEAFIELDAARREALAECGAPT